MKVNHDDINEMRRLEKELANLQEEYDRHWCAVEHEEPDPEFHEAEMKRIQREINALEQELDIVGGFDGE